MNPIRLISRRALLRAGLVITAGATIPALFAGDAKARRHSSSHRAAPPVSPGAHQPNPLTAPYAAACAMEPTTGTVMFDHDMNRPWPTASLAKMMVMLIVAKKIGDGSLKLTDKVTTSATATRSAA